MDRRKIQWIARRLMVQRATRYKWTDYWLVSKDYMWCPKCYRAEFKLQDYVKIAKMTIGSDDLEYCAKHGITINCPRCERLSYDIIPQDDKIHAIRLPLNQKW